MEHMSGEFKFFRRSNMTLDTVGSPSNGLGCQTVLEKLNRTNGFEQKMIPSKFHKLL